MKSLTKALKPSYFCEAPQCKRLFSSKDKTVFEQALKQRHRNFALSETVDTTYYNYLRQESNLQLIDRVNDINREFPVGLELGSFDGGLYNLINSQPTLRGNQGGIGGIQYLVQTDMSAKSANNISPPANSLVTKDSLQCNEGYLPFQSNSFDIVLSSLYLHWSNDLFKTFSEIERVLKPDGVVIASLLGNDSLKELRNCFYLAEQERRGGIAYHTSPFMRTWDVAGLMQDAKFNLPTVDIDSVKISYPNAFVLMDHLQKMGESNANTNRSLAGGKDTFLSMASLYQELYGLEDGSVNTTFEIIYLIGWKHHDSQQKPCKRGSAQISMTDLTKS